GAVVLHLHVPGPGLREVSGPCFSFVSSAPHPVTGLSLRALAVLLSQVQDVRAPLGGSTSVIDLPGDGSAVTLHLWNMLFCAALVHRTKKRAPVSQLAAHRGSLDRKRGVSQLCCASIATRWPCTQCS